MDILLSSLKCLTLYLVVIICLRLLGKKTVSEISSVDLVFMILLGSTFGQQLPEDKFVGALAAIGTVTIANYIISLISFKFPAFRRLVEDVPVVLIRDGKVDKDKLKSEMVTEDDLNSVLRNKEVEDINEIKIAVLETTGKINVIKKKQNK